MSTRERWIVYPLLFLTLGIAMRNQFLPTKRFGAMDLKAADITAQTIHCNNLEVMQDGIIRNNLGVAQEIQFQRARGNAIRADYSESLHSKSVEAECHNMILADEQDKPLIIMQEDKNTKTGMIQTVRSDGAPQVQIRSNDTGGIVTAVGHQGQVLVAMGHEGQTFGVFAQFPQSGRPPFPITSPWQFQSQPSLPKFTPTPVPKTPPEEKREEPKKEEPNSKNADNP
jgi:hypothetical protein